jgi:hypothetical protein
MTMIQKPRRPLHEQEDEPQAKPVRKPNPFAVKAAEPEPEPDEPTDTAPEKPAEPKASRPNPFAARAAKADRPAAAPETQPASKPEAKPERKPEPKPKPEAAPESEPAATPPAKSPAAKVQPLEPGAGAPSYQDAVMDAYGVPTGDDDKPSEQNGTEQKLDRAASLLLSRMKSKLSGKDAILGPYSAMIQMLIDEVAADLEILSVDVIRAFTAEHYHDPVMYFEIKMARDDGDADAEMLDNHAANQKLADEHAAQAEDIWEGYSIAERQALLKRKAAEHRRCLETNAAVHRATGTLQALEEEIASLRRSLTETTSAGCVAGATGGFAPLSDFEGEYPYYTPKKKKKTKLAKQPVVRRAKANEMIAVQPHWVCRNPDRETFARLLGESQGRLHGLLDRDLHVWPAAASDHASVVARHGIDGTEIEIREGRVILNGTTLLVETHEPVVNWVARHDGIRRLFGGGFSVAVRASH